MMNKNNKKISIPVSMELTDLWGNIYSIDLIAVIKAMEQNIERQIVHNELMDLNIAKN